MSIRDVFGPQLDVPTNLIALLFVVDQLQVGRKQRSRSDVGAKYLSKVPRPAMPRNPLKAP